MVFAGIVRVFVAGTDNAVRSQEPGYLQLARVVGTQHGQRDERLQLGTGRRHVDFLRREARHRPFSDGGRVTVTSNIPAECQFLAKQVVGHHPLGTEPEGLAVAVAHHGLISSVVLRQTEGVSRITQRNVEETIGIGAEVHLQRGVAVVDVCFRLPSEDGHWISAVYRHPEVTFLDPRVGTARVIARSREVDDIRATQFHCVVVGIVLIREIRRRRLWQQPSEERQQHQPPLPSQNVCCFVHNE